MTSASGEPRPLVRALALVGVPLLVVAAVAIVFAPALDAGFLHWDDDSTITRNTAFRGFAREHLAWMLSTGTMGHYQPLAWLSFALDHALEPLVAPDFAAAARRFHLTNLIGHALAALAVYWASLEVLALALRRPRLDPTAVFSAAFAALFFAIHPLRVESVAWVTERRDLISGAFFALALVAWVRHGRAAGASYGSARRAALGVSAACVALVLALASVERGAAALAWRGPGAWGLAAAFALVFAGGLACAAPGARGAYAAALACLVLSLLAKAWGMVLPVLFLLLDVGPLGRARDARSWIAAAREKVPLIAVALAFASLAAWAQGLHAYTQPALADHTPLERVAQAGYGAVFYPWKTLWPASLVPIVELPNRLELLSIRFGPPLALALALSVASLLGLRRAPNASLAWLAYLVTIAPVLGVLQSGPQLVADRYAYLATLPLGWLVAGALGQAFARGGALRALAVAGSLAWLVALGLAAERQTRVWRDDLTLWEHAYALNPEGPEIQKQLAFAYLQLARTAAEPKRRYDLNVGALGLLERAAAVKPDARTWGNLSLVHRALAPLDPMEAARHAELALELARRALAEAERTGFDLADYRMNLGAVLMDQGRFDEARAEFEAVTRDAPELGWGWMNLGLALAALGRGDEAAGALRRATELLPRAAEPWRHLGEVLEKGGERAGAREAFERGLALAPGDPALASALARVR